MKRKILFVFNGPTMSDGKVGVSGGDVRLMEIIKHVKNFEVEVLTTSNGRELIRSWGVPYSKLHVIPYIVGGEILSQFAISLKSLFQLPQDVKSFKGIVYSSCEHLYDVLPALRMKLLNGCEWYAVYHWVEDYPWKEKRGGTPFLKRYLYWLNRWFSGFLIKIFSDSILAVSDQTKEKLVRIKKVKEGKVRSVYCGVNYGQIKDIAKKHSDEKGAFFEAVYMKRLNHGKGIFDLLKIWKLVCQKKPDAKLVIIGDGPEDVILEIRNFIVKNRLEKNILLKGVVYDFEEKFRIINSAKIFILPSHEENWAIVIGEAMAAGVPVVAYDLVEIRPIWKDNVKWVEFGNLEEFSEKIIELLNDEDIRDEIEHKSDCFIKDYDWKSISETEFE